MERGPSPGRLALTQGRLVSAMGPVYVRFPANRKVPLSQSWRRFDGAARRRPERRPRRAPPSSAASPAPSTHRSASGSPSRSLRQRYRSASQISVRVATEAGGDSHATHAAIVRARRGRDVAPGPGVGTVTLPDLFLAGGGAAVNAGPRTIVADNLRTATRRLRASGRYR